MISNILVTALDNAMNLWIEDRVLAIILMLVISAILDRRRNKNIYGKLYLFYLCNSYIVIFRLTPSLEIPEFKLLNPDLV